MSDWNVDDAGVAARAAIKDRELNACMYRDECSRMIEEITTLRQQLAESGARVAELSNLCERLQHCAQGFYVDQGDYGHMEAIMKDYHWIMRASKPWRDSYIKRVQAEAVEEAARLMEAAGNAFDAKFAASDYAQRLRQHAAELEQKQ